MKYFLLIVVLAVAKISVAQTNYPVPPGSAHRLFYIQHDANHNTFVYDANFMKPKVLNFFKPVEIYRIVYTEGAVKKELTFLQQKMAYGLNIRKLGDNNYELSLIAYPKQKLFLRLDKTGKAYVETTINGKKMVLNRMFLQSKAGTSGLKTKFEYFLFYGTDEQGRNIVEKLLP